MIDYSEKSLFLNQERRDFLKTSVAMMAGVPLSLWSKESRGETDAQLNVVRNGVAHKIPFIQKGKMDEGGYGELCRVFADMQDRVAVQMDPNLFLVLSRAQQWLASNAIHRPIILTSGYRTQHTNSITEGAAFNSMHLYGKAADIHIKGIPTEYLARLLRMCGGSGIGIYPSFVHVDTWKMRHWRG